MFNGVPLVFFWIGAVRSVPPPSARTVRRVHCPFSTTEVCLVVWTVKTPVDTTVAVRTSDVSLFTSGLPHGRHSSVYRRGPRTQRSGEDAVRGQSRFGHAASDRSDTYVHCVCGWPCRGGELSL